MLSLPLTAAADAFIDATLPPYADRPRASHAAMLPRAADSMPYADAMPMPYAAAMPRSAAAAADAASLR